MEIVSANIGEKKTVTYKNKTVENGDEFKLPKRNSENLTIAQLYINVRKEKGIK